LVWFIPIMAPMMAFVDGISNKKNGDIEYE